MSNMVSAVPGSRNAKMGFRAGVPHGQTQQNLAASGCATLKPVLEPESDDIDRVAEALQDHFIALRPDSSMRQAACAAITAARDGWSNGDDAAAISELRDALIEAETENDELRAQIDRLEASVARLASRG